MFTESSVHEPPAAFAGPGERRGDASSLRRRVVALMRTVDEREATIASLVRQLHRARNDPSRSASLGRLTAAAAHQMQAPIHRAIDNARSLRRSFERVEAAGSTVAAMPVTIDQLLDDLDRVAALVRAMENFSPAVETSVADAA